MNNLISIPEFKEVLKEYKDLKRKTKNLRNKIDSLNDKYSFVDEVANPEFDGIKLESSVQKLFSDIGYECNKPETTADVDIIISYSSEIIGVEVKGDEHLGENEAFQGIKYTARHNRNGLVMKTLVIWNNSKKNHSFDNNRIIDSENHNYTIITTKELLKGYFKLKQNKLDLNFFHKTITTKGLASFTNKRVKENR
jgi:hypothetical protein